MQIPLSKALGKEPMGLKKSSQQQLNADVLTDGLF